MATTGRAVTVGTTATRIDNRGSNTTTATGHLVRCDDGDIWIGGPGVTTTGGTEGYKQKAGEPLPVSFNGGAQLYAVAASSVKVYVLDVAP